MKIDLGVKENLGAGWADVLKFCGEGWLAEQVFHLEFNWKFTDQNDVHDTWRSMLSPFVMSFKLQLKSASLILEAFLNISHEQRCCVWYSFLYPLCFPIYPSTKAPPTMMTSLFYRRPWVEPGTVSSSPSMDVVPDQYLSIEAFFGNLHCFVSKLNILLYDGNQKDLESDSNF